MAMDRVFFKVNGDQCSVGREVSSDVTLVDFLRNCLELRGTKYMCREAGCGACIVSVVRYPGAPVEAVNSCMVLVTSCHGWDITTIEKVGNRKDGYNIVQSTLADYNGTQCGHCSPGWVMAMFSLVKDKKELSMLEIEQSFGSNICRCTGYRPILEAFKKFAKDSPQPYKLTDIEDLNKMCEKTGLNCDKENCEKEDDWCIISNEDVIERSTIEIKLSDGKLWYKVNEVREIFRIFNNIGTDSYMLVNGNTAKGAYPILEYPKILIDISGVQELQQLEIDQNLKIGAGITLTNLLAIFKTMSEHEGFSYLIKFYEHLSLVAHIPVRNIGSLGGNLMIKHQHNDFPSDLFILLVTVNAQVAVKDKKIGPVVLLDMQKFLKLNMKGKVLMYVLLPPLSDLHRVVTFKVMPRSQSAHAVVNAGFMYKINGRGKVGECRITYGGLSPQFVRAVATERYLIGKTLFRNETLTSALNILGLELIVTENPPEPSVEYRKKLALHLFYKGLLTLCPPDILNNRYKSGAIKIHETRPVSEARQIFNTNPTLWPLNQPIPKVEALIQCSGEAKYTEDMPKLPNEVFGALVLSTVPLGDIVKIDASVALKMPEVIAFYSAKDIPGENSFTPAGAQLYLSNEEIFCSGKVKYFNQPIGMIVATTQHIANRAAKKVQVKYKNQKKPVLDIKEAKKDSNRSKLFTTVKATARGNDVVKVISGGNTIYGQYHFVMETLVCVTKPTEEGIEVHTSGQWMDGTQYVISRALKLQANRIDVYVLRLGGAYGLKVSRSMQVATACSLVVQKLNRPCRCILELRTVTRAMGKRLPCSTDFEVGVNSAGVIQYIDYKLYEDNGYGMDEIFNLLGEGVFNNCYDKSRWNYSCYDTLTDTALNTWCRAPGTLENIAMAEYIMEQISYELSLDPLEVRLANLDTVNYNDLREMSDNLNTIAEYSTRRIAVTKFNAENRWKKRGLRFTLLRWTPLGVQPLDVNLSVFHTDGTVAITHGGIEMGQGINTKAVQVCAYMLKIPINKIQIKANSTINAPNNSISGGSLTSQNVALGVKRSCDELLSRLAPVRQNMNNPTWEELIRQAFDLGIDLQTHGYVGMNDVHDFQIYGVSLAESEIDILTGETQIVRVDILQDAGQSISPQVDIGQVEGAFIMGHGYWTTEELVYDKNTGELLTDRTWNYNVPLARDIPQDFRVYFRNNSYSAEKYFGAKCIGEPPMCMSVVIAFAIREAIAAARQESGIPTNHWFQIDGPYTVEKTCLSCKTNIEDLKFN